MSFPSHSSNTSANEANPTPTASTGAPGSRPQQYQSTFGASPQPRQGSRRGLTPISTSATASAAQTRPGSASGSPSRAAFSPTNPGFNLASHAANRQVGSSRQSSTSSTNSLISPSGNSGQYPLRARNLTAGSPRPGNPSAHAASLSQATQNASGIVGGAPSRFSRHSPSISVSNTGSPISAGPHNAGASSHSSIVTTQLNILLSTIRADDQAKWDTQAEKIWRLVDANGMETYLIYFRRLLTSNASTIFPANGRHSETSNNYQLLVTEVHKILQDPQQGEKIAQSLDTTEGELFRDFDLSAFLEHFRLDPVSKVAVALPCRTVTKPDIRNKGEAILTNNFQSFLHTLSSPVNAQTGEPSDNLPSAVLASLLDRIAQEPPRSWNEEQRTDLKYAIRVRYSRLNAPIPSAIESAMSLVDLLESQDSRLARRLQQYGPRATASLDACKEVLAGVETRDISYVQIANALLFTVVIQNGDAYNPAVFVEGLRQHRAGPKIDWTDVVQGFDREGLTVTKKQFLALYNALLPLAKEHNKLDIQTMWGGPWQSPETQLSFVVAFLSTTPEELDVRQIPDFRPAFTLEDFEDASESVRAFAAEAVKHPLVSRDATEALFTMIFRSQDTYNQAQMLGIPDTLINPNMTVFLVAAAAVPKPWAALQEQALKQLFYPFLLKQHDNYDFVMHALWKHDKTWVAARIVEFYTQDQTLLALIFEHAQEHGWIELLLTIQNTFTIDLAAYAHGKNVVSLEEWSQQHVAAMGLPQFARVILDFLRHKLDDESLVQKEDVPRTSVPLALRTVSTLLLLGSEALLDEEHSALHRQCLQTYPRLINYGDDEKINAILESSCDQGHALPEEASAQMEEQYKRMYGGEQTVQDVIHFLKHLKASENAVDQDLFACMIHGLFDEYNCFGEYPHEALATTAVLFGGIINYNVLGGVSLNVALHMVFESVSEYGPENSMYKFGLQAILSFPDKFRELPLVCERIVSIPSLRGTDAMEKAQMILQQMGEESVGINGDGPSGINGAGIDPDEFPADSPTPAFSSINIDPPLRPEIYEEPDEDTSDKVMFVLNNVSKRNLDEKFKDLKGALEERHHQWFAHYLVEELAKSQPNFQALYLQILDNFNERVLWQEVVRETYASCAKMLNSQSTMDSATERTNLKNLALWLGSLTLARNQPVLSRNISFKDLLLEAHDSSRLLVAIPFTCKVLSQAQRSRVFLPPNPWLMELLGFLSELYHFMELKLNMKFEVEVLCKDLGLDVKTIEPLDIIRSRPMLHQDNMLQQYVPEGGPDAFGDMHLMGLSKRAPNERFSPASVIDALPDLRGMLHIPQAAGNVTQTSLEGIFINAAQAAIHEIIAPVVERSVTIAAISTSELIQKDFATEVDVDKLRSSAHTVVKALSGSLALVTCKEPLRMSITNNIRILASRSLPEQLPEGQILMFVNDNIDNVCNLVENAAEQHSLAEIDAQLDAAVKQRAQHLEQRPNEQFDFPPVNRWAQLIPDPYRQELGGLNRQQLNLYEEFGRQARITPVTHGGAASSEGTRQLPDMLADTYLPASLQTPSEAPTMPRQTPQQRTQGLNAAQHQANGYVGLEAVGRRIQELLQDLQQATREASEEQINDIGPDAPTRRIFEQIVPLVESSMQKDDLAAAAGGEAMKYMYFESQRRLEVEVFARLLGQLCQRSTSYGRMLAMQLSSFDDEKMLNPVVTVALINEGLMETQLVDIQVARLIRARRLAALDFMRDLADEALLGDSPIAIRSDFAHTYEAMSLWLAEDPELEVGAQLMSKLTISPRAVNGMPSPPESDKQDQLEYVFEEWVRLQRRDVPERTYAAFVQQLHKQGILADADSAMAFFRTSLDTAVVACERAMAIPFGNNDQAFIQLDALAKLIACLVIYQGPEEEEGPSKKPKFLEALFRVVVLVMNDLQVKHKERFSARAYFRLFSTTLCELHGYRAQLGLEVHLEVLKVFARAMLVLQPKYFTGFSFSWLALVSHRLFVPVLLKAPGRTGWDTYVKILETVFVNFGLMTDSVEAAPLAQDFYRGVLRLLVMLGHDFPEFVAENHTRLNSSVPHGCSQLQNMINTSTPAPHYDQPDPFSQGLKINRLEQIRMAPLVNTDVEKILQDVGIKEQLDHVLSGSETTDGDYSTVFSVVSAATPLVINAFILYTGIKATSTSSSFSSAASPARLLERLLRESSPDGRYALLAAMTNQVRYVNAHTHYFSTALNHLFNTNGEAVQQTILRVLVERLQVVRPHPWGLIVTVLELVKNQAYGFWEAPWVKAAPQVEGLLVQLAAGQREREGLAQGSQAQGEAGMLR
ncbi:hypothetical protein MBLNU230_g2005t1 [Neophaeotheca triangularis]